ncbi:hypothetical protein IX324_002155 [Bacteroides pyogenes]|nr:hypothetical protein [Bacteroides pyogenes]
MRLHLFIQTAFWNVFFLAYRFMLWHAEEHQPDFPLNQILQSDCMKKLWENRIFA